MSHLFLYQEVPFPSVVEVLFPKFIVWVWSTGVAAWRHAWRGRHAPAPIRTVGTKANAHGVILVWLRRPGVPPLL